MQSPNDKILKEGSSFPIVELKNGVQIRTGTVANLIHNILEYDQKPSSDLAKDLADAIPALIEIGLFKLFPPDCWVEGSSPGKKLIGELAKDFLKEKDKV